MESIFITGSDTNVGKTIISAGLLKLMHGHRKVRYWKPIQTGTIMNDDTNDVRAMVEYGPECFMEPAYRFPEPLAPRHAAKKWGKEIDVDHVVQIYQDRPDKERFTIIEGAGGIEVPLNDRETQRHLIKKLGLPILIVAEDRIGAINHTVLTIEAARREGVEIAGVILSKAKGTYGNADSIAHFGKVEVLAEFPPYEDSRTVVAQVSCHPRLRQMFGVPPMPA